MGKRRGARKVIVRLIKDPELGFSGGAVVVSLEIKAIFLVTYFTYCYLCYSTCKVKGFAS